MDILKASQLRKQGLSYRKIAGQLGVSHQHVYKKLKTFQMDQPQPPASEVEAINKVLSQLPPAGGSFAVPSVQQFAGLISAWRNWYLSPDEAIRHSRENARRMFLNLVIREPLQSRLLSVAELPWHIEPEDKKDPEQMKVAQGIQQIIEESPDFLKLRYALLLATWFGRYGVQIRYGWDYSKGYKRLVIKEWSPVHGDSLVYKWDSDDVGIYVGMYMNYKGTKELTTEPAFLSRAHVLTDTETQYYHEHGKPYHKLGLNERDAFVIHTHDVLAGDFMEPEAAGGVKGIGIRSTVYWTWYVMNEIAGWLIEFLERVGTGITIWRYLRGNDESYKSVKEIAESQSNQAAILFPSDPALSKNGEDVERIEPSPVGIDNMLKVLDDHYGSQIRRYIIGQDATSRPIPTGIGSKLAETHENTFARIVKYDAINLEETLTHQFVRVIQRWTYPDANFKCRFVIDVEKMQDLKEYMEAVQAFVSLGGEVDEDEVRSRLGLTKPAPGDKVLGGQLQMPGMGGPGGNPFRHDGKEQSQPKGGDWQEYRGPRGARGWRNTQTGRVHYG